MPIHSSSSHPIPAISHMELPSDTKKHISILPPNSTSFISTNESQRSLNFLRDQYLTYSQRICLLEEKNTPTLEKELEVCANLQKIFKSSKSKVQQDLAKLSPKQLLLFMPHLYVESTHQKLGEHAFNYTDKRNVLANEPEFDDNVSMLQAYATCLGFLNNLLENDGPLNFFLKGKKHLENLQNFFDLVYNLYINIPASDKKYNNMEKTFYGWSSFTCPMNAFPMKLKKYFLSGDGITGTFGRAIRFFSEQGEPKDITSIKFQTPCCTGDEKKLLLKQITDRMMNVFLKQGANSPACRLDNLYTLCVTLMYSHFGRNGNGRVAKVLMDCFALSSDQIPSAMMTSMSSYVFHCFDKYQTFIERHGLRLFEQTHYMYVLDKITNEELDTHASSLRYSYKDVLKKLFEECALNKITNEELDTNSSSLKSRHENFMKKLHEEVNTDKNLKHTHYEYILNKVSIWNFEILISSLKNLEELVRSVLNRDCSNIEGEFDGSSLLLWLDLSPALLHK